MKQFSRLRDEGGTDVERLLLGSATDDAPMPGARVKVLAALGVAGVAASTAGTAHAASAVLVGTAGGKTASTAAGFSLAKWLLIGAVAGVTTTGSVVVVTTPGLFGQETRAVPGQWTRAASPSRATEAPKARAATAEEGEKPTPHADHGARSPVEPSVPRARSYSDEEPGADRAPVPQGTAFPSAGADTVAEEVTALDRARAALAAGDGSGALARLDAYERRYPKGTLLPEAAVLRVRALVQLGRSRDARSVVDAFVRAHPGSPQAARLRALVGGGE